jgi:peptidoglycan/LPS O-acetylase OafA/YrhL
MMSLDVSPAPPVRAEREMTFDLLKGIGILEVIFHHLLSFSARKFAIQGEPEWWAMMLANRILHFAVPTFLLASALLLARSIASKAKPDWQRFYRRRLERTAWPYLVWTVIFVLFRVFILKTGTDVSPTVAYLPWGEAFLGPYLLVSVQGWIHNLIWGKGYFHLYFMAVLFQFSLFFPLLYFILKRYALQFGHLLLLCIPLQFGVFSLQSKVLAPRWGFATPGSLALWYLPALLLGMWIGLNWKQWPSVWKAWKLRMSLVTLAGFLVYISVSMAELAGARISSLLYNSSATIYTTGMAFLLLGVSSTLKFYPPLGQSLARMGNWSLPLFLIHPLILYFLGGPTLSRFLDSLPLTLVWVSALLLGLTWMTTLFLQKARMDKWLFGRML